MESLKHGDTLFRLFTDQIWKTKSMLSISQKREKKSAALRQRKSEKVRSLKTAKGSNSSNSNLNIEHFRVSSTISKIATLNKTVWECLQEKAATLCFERIIGAVTSGSEHCFFIREVRIN